MSIRDSSQSDSISKSGKYHICEKQIYTRLTIVTQCTQEGQHHTVAPTQATSTVHASHVAPSVGNTLPDTEVSTTDHTMLDTDQGVGWPHSDDTRLQQEYTNNNNNNQRSKRSTSIHPHSRQQIPLSLNHQSQHGRAQQNSQYTKNLNQNQWAYGTEQTRHGHQ